MTTFFVLHVLDVNYAAITAPITATITAGGSTLPLVPTRAPGELKIALPAGTSTFEVAVQGPPQSFWPMTQKLRIQPGSLPTITFDGPQDINARSVSAHQSGADANVTLDVVLGHLRDARSKVDAVFNAGRIASLSPLKADLRDLDTPILDPQGKGWKRLHHAVKKDQTADGQMFYVERPTVPKLVAIYRPPHIYSTFQVDNKNPFGFPVAYHAFFHPSTSKFKGDYPFSFQYIDLIARYVLYPQVFSIGKSMANQHFISGKKCVFVFPVGHPTQSFGNIPNQAELHRLFQEVSYWLQRKQGIAWPLCPVGRCAVSAFSAGCVALLQMLGRPSTPFDRDHLREIYGLDLFVDPPQIPGACAALKQWFRSGRDNRRLRVYTQNLTWFSLLRSLLPNPTIATGPSNAVEEETAQSTLLYNPKGSFWRDMSTEVTPEPPLNTFDSVPSAITSVDQANIQAKKAESIQKNNPALFQKFMTDLEIAKYYEVHQMIPALFMSHALKLSKFSDP